MTSVFQHRARSGVFLGTQKTSAGHAISADRKAVGSCFCRSIPRTGGKAPMVVSADLCDSVWRPYLGFETLPTGTLRVPRAITSSAMHTFSSASSSHIQTQDDKSWGREGIRGVQVCNQMRRGLVSVQQMQWQEKYLGHSPIVLHKMYKCSGLPLGPTNIPKRGYGMGPFLLSAHLSMCMTIGCTLRSLRPRSSGKEGEKKGRACTPCPPPPGVQQSPTIPWGDGCQLTVPQAGG